MSHKSLLFSSGRPPNTKRSGMLHSSTTGYCDLMGTSHFRVTAAVPGSSVTYVTVGFPRKSSSKGVGGSREVNEMKNYF